MLQSRHPAFVVTIAILIVAWSCCQLKTIAENAPVKALAGKTVDQYASDINDENRTVRLRAAKSLSAMGQSAGKTLRRALGHDDPAVRYIAATGLGRIGGDALAAAQSSLEKLADDEQSHAARMAACFALCKLGKTSDHLDVLIKTLTHRERGVVCAAAELLGEIGPPANQAIDELQSVHAKNKAGVKGGDYHIGGAAMNALRKIDPENFQ
tara:strand:- start:231044 stop:231676 length:633 start_codon:yes stop_codon:yes gene_type:complete